MDDSILEQDRNCLVRRMGHLVQKEVRGLSVSGIHLLVKPEIMVDREIEALNRLTNVPGIQRFVSRQTPTTFTTYYMHGGALKHYSLPLPQSYFDELEDITQACFKQGVYRVGQNSHDFIVLPHQRPGIIDFGNIIFKEETIPRSLGLLTLVKLYSHERIRRLRTIYGN